MAWHLGIFSNTISRSTEPNAADNVFHGREEGVPLAPSTVTSRMGCGFHKTLDRGSQKETQRSVLGRHHHFCLSMSGDFDFAITSPSLMRSLCGQVQSFQSAVCASSSSIPNLQGRVHSEGAGLAPLKGPFLITLVSGSPGWPQTHYIIKDDLELVILLPPLPRHWNYACVLSYPVSAVYGDRTQGFMLAQAGKTTATTHRKKCKLCVLRCWKS